jgi:predicted ArsR family transcriptional regulator
MLASLERRPQTPGQLASALLATEEEIGRALAELLTQGLAEEVRRDGAAQANPKEGRPADGAPRYYQARRG